MIRVTPNRNGLMIEDTKGEYILYQSHRREIHIMSNNHYGEVVKYREMVEDLKNKFRAIFDIAKEQMGLDIDYTSLRGTSQPCADCSNQFVPMDLIPWKYEPEILLCEDCISDRLRDE